MTYDELVAQLDGRALDRGYQSAVFLLGGLMPDHRIDAAISLDPHRELIDWAQLLTLPSWSTGEYDLIYAARSLFRGHGGGFGSIGELAEHLDEPNLERVLEAIRIRAGLSPVPST